MTEKNPTNFQLSLFHKQLTITQMQVQGRWENHTAKDKVMAGMIYITFLL